MTKPAPYSSTSIKETIAITTLRSLIDANRVFLHIRELDRIPDVDGDLDILDEEHRPIGKCEVQVKKLPDDYASTPKLQVPLSVFGYASTSTNNPVILIGVDIVQKKAYWYHVPKDANLKSGQQTITIPFPLTQLIDGKNVGYIAEWLKISREIQKKVREYSNLEYSNSKLAPAYARLSKIVNAAGGVTKAEFREIHTFLDSLNSFLDGPFSLVKRRFYPNAWKVGFAYHDYDDSSVSYTIYPISFELNDVQIKEIDTSLRDELVALNGMTAISNENPIKSRSWEHALEIMERRIEQLTKFRLLDHKGSEFLAREFIVAFVDEFAELMGLQNKDSYTLAEIWDGFYRHLPIWVEETVKLFVRVGRNGIQKPADCYYGKPYFEPGILSHQLLPNEVDEVENLVVQRVKTKDAIPVIALGSEQFPFGLFVEFHSFLAGRGVIEVPRLYKPPDYSKVPNGGWIWEPYSSDDVETNLRTLFDALPSVYATIVDHNFPELKSQLLPFDGANLVIAVFQIKDERPSLDLYYLKHGSDSDLRVEMVEIGQSKEALATLDTTSHKLERDGRTYTLIASASIFPRFIYDDLPMLTFVYDELRDALKKYFDERTRAGILTRGLQ
jgi:hypothetical protein